LHLVGLLYIIYKMVLCWDIWYTSTDIQK